MQNTNTTFKEVLIILGRQVINLLVLSFFCGLTLFFLEYSFIYSLQLFLVTIGFVDADKIESFSWLPDDQISVLALFLTVGALRSIVMMCKAYLGGAVTQTFLRTQRQMILEYALVNSHDDSSYNITALFTDKVNRAATVLRVLSTFLMTITSSLCLLAAGFYLAPSEMMLGLLSFAIVLFPMKYLNNKLLRAGDGLTNSWDNTLRYLLEGLKFHKFFKVHSLIKKQIDDGFFNINRYEKHYKRYFLFAALKNGFPNFIGIFIVIFIVYFSLFNFKTPPSKLIAFLYIFMRLAHALSESNADLNDFRLNKNLLKDYFLWHKQNSKRKYENRKPLQLSQKNSIELHIDQVSHHFEDIKVLEQLSLNVKTGDILVIKGESGSGKSTLLHIILGLLKPSQGKIKVNDQIVGNFEFGKSIAYVGPEPVLFEGTIKENLLFGNESQGVSDASIWKVLDQVCLKDHIASLKNGIHEKLSENAEFSTGQKQRLCLGRAILRNSQILILDEATANLDHETEEKIIKNLTPTLNEKLSIIVSHKPSFDQIGTHNLNLPQKI